VQYDINFDNAIFDVIKGKTPVPTLVLNINNKNSSKICNLTKYFTNIVDSANINRFYSGMKKGAPLNRDDPEFTIRIFNSGTESININFPEVRDNEDNKGVAGHIVSVNRSTIEQIDAPPRGPVGTTFRGKLTTIKLYMTDNVDSWKAAKRSDTYRFYVGNVFEEEFAHKNSF
jgi:hypothetical protein